MEGTVELTPNMMKSTEEMLPAMMGLGSEGQLGKMYAAPYLFSNTSVDVPQIFIKSSKNAVATITA